MGKKLLKAGKIVTTHGIKGELRVELWCDGPEFLSQFKTFYIDGAEHRVTACRKHKSMAIISLEGYSDINAAMALIGREIQIDVSQVQLSPGSYFIEDLVGLAAVDAATGAEFGRVTDVLTLPAHDVYEVKGEKNYLIPAVKAFVEEVNIPEGHIKFKLIEGLEQ